MKPKKKIIELMSWAFHNAIHKYIEEKLAGDSNSLEQDIIERLGEDGDIPNGVQDFSGLGEISIQIIEEMPVEVKQKNMEEEELEEYLSKQKSNKNLSEVSGNSSQS